MTERKRETLKLKEGGTKYLLKDGKPDVVRQKKHDDEIKKVIAEASKTKAPIESNTE